MENAECKVTRRKKNRVDGSVSGPAFLNVIKGCFTTSFFFFLKAGPPVFHRASFHFATSPPFTSLNLLLHFCSFFFSSSNKKKGKNERREKRKKKKKSTSKSILC